MAVANKYADKPVVLIAINSGNSPRDVAAYASRNSLVIPIIADSDRSFEKALNVGVISTKNIFQLTILDANGRLQRGNPTQTKEAFEKAIASGASWNVEPAGMPKSLQLAWKKIEFGNYAGAARSVTTGLKSHKDEVKSAAEKLHSYVKEKLDSKLAAAKKLTGDKYKSYAELSMINKKFKGYELPDDLGDKVKELARDPQVKKEIAAMKRLEAAKRLLSIPVIASKNRGAKLLQAILKANPGTQAGDEAQAILEELESQQ